MNGVLAKFLNIVKGPDTIPEKISFANPGKLFNIPDILASPIIFLTIKVIIRIESIIPVCFRNALPLFSVFLIFNKGIPKNTINTGSYKKSENNINI